MRMAQFCSVLISVIYEPILEDCPVVLIIVISAIRTFEQILEVCPGLFSY